MERRRFAKFILDVSIYHDPGCVHRVVCSYIGVRNGWIPAGEWSWKGFGVPADLLADLLARVDSVLTEHLVQRYGIQGTLPTNWAGEAPEP